MTLVAVAPNRHAYGVESHLDDWRVAPGGDGNCRALRSGQRGVRADYRVSDLGNALAATYTTDAHLVAYVVRDPRGAPLTHQPRVNKAGLGFLLSLGYTLALDALLADLDNPAHCDWTPELFAIARRDDAQLATAGVYYTEHGRRVVQPLSRPVPVSLAEDVQHAWLLYLRSLGLHPDMSCVDWTRHFRLPHVRRGGKPFRSPVVDLARMQPIDPPAPVPRPGKGAVRRAHVALGRPGDVAASPLGAALERAGLLGRELGPGKATALCPFRAGHSVGRDHDSSTVVFGSSATQPLGWLHCSHASCSHRAQRDFLGALPADARALVDDARRAARAHAPERVTMPRDDARLALERAFRDAPDGLSVVIAGCGTGKTEAALVVARERAAAPPTPTGRAPLGSRTSISVPTNQLAIELAARAGIPVRRIFGVLSVVDPVTRKPVCVYADAAGELAEGGLSVPWELCEGRGRAPCDYADTCPARGGVAGPDDARLTIGPHALLGALNAAAGKTSDLVVDEPPPLLTHHLVSPEQLTAAIAELGYHFESRYADALTVSLAALAAWIGTGPLDVAGPLTRGVDVVDPELLERAFVATGAETAVDAAHAAFDPAARSTAPPVRRASIEMARRSRDIAHAIGQAARVAGLVWRCLTAPPGKTIARLEERTGRGETVRRVLVISVPDEQLLRALHREGRCLVADAGGRLHLPVYERIVGYTPRVVEVHVADGAPVERVHIRARATRAAWMPRGILVDVAGVARAVAAVVDWLLDGPPTPRVAVITFQALEIALRCALHGVAEADRADWRKLAQHPPTLDAAVAALRPILARLAGVTVDLGHYGAIRGLDHWRDHDALVTIGDPWSHLTDARWEAQYLELPDPDERYAAHAAHELEQAHGRLRTVHRTRPARALHVGHVRPGGWPTTVDTRELPPPRGGRPRQLASADGAALVRRYVEAAGGVERAARLLGRDRRSLLRYSTGERGCPPDVLAALSLLAPSERNGDVCQ